MNAYMCKKHILILVFFKISNGLFTCLQSAPTIAFVDFCPRNKAEWDSAADKKNCNSMATHQNCTDAAKFQYHCLMNHHRNATLEVCAPIFYLQGYCPIYDTGTKEVSENYNPGYECLKFSGTEHCPARYPSSEAYKYQRCYELDSATSKATECTKQRNLRSEYVYIAVIVVLILLLIPTVVALLILIYKSKVFDKFFKKEDSATDTDRETAENAATATASKTAENAATVTALKTDEKEATAIHSETDDAEKRLLPPDGIEMNEQHKTITLKGTEKKESKKNFKNGKPKRPPPPTRKTGQQKSLTK